LDSYFVPKKYINFDSNSSASGSVRLSFIILMNSRGSEYLDCISFRILPWP